MSYFYGIMRDLVFESAENESLLPAGEAVSLFSHMWFTYQMLANLTSSIR